jgi:Na+-transporting NADH:ubiquinone oxidoreductase subunit C
MPESPARTLLIAVVISLICSAMVSAAVHWLRPIQAANTLMERNRALVTAAGLADAGASDAAVRDAYLGLDARVWDLAKHEYNALADGRSFDHWTDQVDVPADLVPVYWVGQGETRLVLPVHGEGMWSTIYGYVALGADLNTITGIAFHRHGETPGIGDRIQDPAWLKSWLGKRIYTSAHHVGLAASEQGEVDPVHRIDLITGASVTSGKAVALVRNWMGPEGYAPLLLTPDS